MNLTPTYLKLIPYILALLPSFLHVPIRRLMGGKIESGARIRFGSIIKTKSLVLKSNVSIGPFSILRADSIQIEINSRIRPFTLVSAKKIQIGEYVQIAPLCIINGDFTPKSKLIVGNHCRIFPFCWLDTGEGITLGNHVGVGGHTLIFTHGVWSNYLEGGPVSFGEVVIEDEVWLPWRVFVMPGVVIGKKSVVGANSVVNKSVPENSLIAGAPAKVIKENFIVIPSIDKQQDLLTTIFNEYVNYKSSDSFQFKEDKVFLPNGLISSNIEDCSFRNIVFLLDYHADFEEGNVQKYKGMNIIYHPQKVAYMGVNHHDADDFILFLRRYGIRLSIIQNK